jgi:pimeloyl-ACP methyl ester carboxylesterase
MLRVLTVLILIFSGFVNTARAEVALLVHGYLGSAASWQVSGINAQLAANGWQPGGVILPGPRGIELPPPIPLAKNKFYTIELPSTAALVVQADILSAALKAISARHPKESITLIGHSAGGVVARMALVRRGVGSVDRLITIASPNQGTVRALQAVDATHEGGPVGWFKDIFGGSNYYAVKDSWPVLLDLSPATPGSTLFWLNNQPQPAIKYISIIRAAPYGLGDAVVPGSSQDLNSIPALHGKAESIVVPADHGLVPADGTMLVRLLAS